MSPGSSSIEQWLKTVTSGAPAGRGSPFRSASGDEVDAVTGVDACAELLRRCGSDDGLAARLEALEKTALAMCASTTGQPVLSRAQAQTKE
jgi:hypothetical protein